jgi:hypothetical protein
MVIERIPHNTATASMAEPFGGSAMLLSRNLTSSSRIPTLIPADQAYYWSIPWQESERQALADIAAGRLQSFADPADAVRYLLGNPE